MSTSSVPRTDGQRATCAAAIAAIAARPGLSFALAALIAEAFDPAAAAYEAARAANDAASLTVARTRDEKNAADQLFKEAFTAWLQSAYYSSGPAAVLADLKPLLGNVSPSVFLGRSARARLERMDRLDLHVRNQPHLVGDLARLDALQAATAALEAATGAWELALEARGVTAAARVEATRAFDRAYSSTVRGIKQLDPDSAALLPTFSRRSRPDPSTTASSGVGPAAPTEPSADPPPHAGEGPPPPESADPQAPCGDDEDRAAA